MSVKLEGGKVYSPKDSDPVECEVHGVKTTWGGLNPIQQLAVEANLDSTPDLRCLLLPRETETETGGRGLSSAKKESVVSPEQEKP